MALCRSVILAKSKEHLRKCGGLHSRGTLELRSTPTLFTTPFFWLINPLPSLPMAVLNFQDWRLSEAWEITALDKKDLRHMSRSTNKQEQMRSNQITAERKLQTRPYSFKRQARASDRSTVKTRASVVTPGPACQTDYLALKPMEKNRAVAKKRNETPVRLG